MRKGINDDYPSMNTIRGSIHNDHMNTAVLMKEFTSTCK